ncbi:DNA repair protein RadA [Pyramidobacter piscolens]|uniref:DNA repair protein RadA n=1 Tax=Pyramidobacter piscolens W5455 TaxID=352165 RepID=A0ABM9ZVK9_9BACT|nr:DNA repair protein RadA [Pyramidobacter piscolens]EFB90949.1 DNA repair protein RadA [Pyramidobacter piscolens W5455]BDF78227.1 DNA repair protein RadA [Pyramidobacter piscolens]
MAKKDGKRYCCIECGYVSLVPSGKCPRCGAWGTLEEEIPVAPSMAAAGTAKILTPVDISTLEPPGRLASGFGELDRVLGGGWVPGGVVLLGGQPGIGKSTLLLQVCGHISAAGRRVLYISGEESPSQLGLRAKRLKILHDGLDVCCHTVIDDALALAKDHSLIVVDSVQAMRTSQAEGWPGTPTQVRATAQVCVNYAKEHGVPMVLVGHITKEGRIAGPMLLEHMVDAVIMFADDNSSVYRTLRASKNRYGGTDEMGIFEMRSDGLTEVPDPSYLYWNRSDGAVSGVVMTVIMEGSRPLVAEIQTLASESSFAYPKRAGIGLGANKIGMLLAVLQSRCALPSLRDDIYCNVAGGLEIHDPGADLALAASMASALTGKNVLSECCLIGEVGLAGEVRPVSGLAQRLREAARLGFKRAVVSSREEKPQLDAEIELIRVLSVSEALARANVVEP